jgi:uncharacterized NAD(P)/FAD-binding protein YdhS
MNVKNTSHVRVLIAGGGFSGVCAAMHLLRQSDRRLDIILVEPATQLGGGLAHSSTDPDHRLNAPAAVHVVLPEVPGHLEAWLEAEGRIERDPDALCDGALYPRRSDFGDYVRAQLDEIARKSVSRLRQLPDRAMRIGLADGRFRISLESGVSLDTDACIVATGHERPSLPAFISRDIARSPGYVNDPWNLDALGGIDRQKDVLLIGTALTAADVVATLSRRGHAGHITAISRHGYTPAGQNPSRSSRSLWEAINDAVPEFVARHGSPARVSDIVRILRAAIEEHVAEGRTWHSAFDEVRNAARQLWSALPAPEKSRFLRHARALYDTHRFRLPPQTGQIFERARSSGQLTIVAGRVRSVSAWREGFEVEYRPRYEVHTVRAQFGAIVNCTGPEIRVRRSSNPLIQSLFESDLAREDETGIGLAIDRNGHVLSEIGKPTRGLFVVGALTRGSIGETPAVPLITQQVLALVPALLGDFNIGK